MTLKTRAEWLNWREVSKLFESDAVCVCMWEREGGKGYLVVLIERSKLLNWFFSRLTITWITLKARIKASSKLRRLVQWNLDLTNLYVMNPRYKKQILSVPWHFIKLPGSTVSKLHYKALFSRRNCCSFPDSSQGKNGRERKRRK